MDFHENKAIYLQIGDLLCEQILAGTWPPSEKIPSVREMGVSLQVNPNTALRTYDFLQQRGIIFNKRGIGYFVEEDAVKKILDFRREDFFANTLPSFYKTISLLQITPEEILRRYQVFMNDESFSDGAATKHFRNKTSVTEIMIRFENINKTYPGIQPLHVLKGVNMNIDKGEFVSIMGASGSGKSTMLNILGILDDYDTGDYFLNGTLIKNLTEKRAAEYRNQMIGFIFQSFNLINFKNALENVALPLYYQGVSRKKRQVQAMEYLDMMGLKDWWHHFPNELSGGQKQRIAIARALISHPKVILADEPTGALDSVTTKEVMQVLSDVNKSGITMIIVTHELSVAENTNRIIHLRDGIIESDSLNSHEIPGIDTLTEILTTMRENKLRTFLTGFAVAWGIFMLIILLGSGNGLKNGVTSNFNDRASNTMMLWGGRTTMPYKGLKAYRRIKLTNELIPYLKNHFTEIDKISGQVDRSSTISFGTENGVYQIYGVQPDYQIISNMAFTTGNGRFLNSRDMEMDRKVIVLSKKVGKSLFKDVNPVGKWVKMDGLTFQVIGVDMKTSNDNEAKCYIPMKTAQKLYSMGNDLNNINFSVQGLVTKEENDDFAQKVREALGRELIINPEDLNTIGIWNQASDYVQTMGIFSTIDLFVMFIGICTLIAGIVGVGNIMVITVKERTREFGIRKALGATPGTILSSILLESIVITSLFGYLGMMFGIGLLELINFAITSGQKAAADGERSISIFMNPTVDLNIVIVATFILILAGLIAGYIPARKAVRIKPIEAMRAE